MASAAPDPRIKAFLAANKEWAGGKDYVPPIPFLEMQKRGRGRLDGTVIIRMSSSSSSFSMHSWVLVKGFFGERKGSLSE